MVILVALVAVVAVSALPVSAAETVVVVNKPVDGLNCSLVDYNFGGRLPVLAVTHNGYMVAFVVESSAIAATLVALVAVVAVVALPLSAAETVVVVNKPDDGLNVRAVEDTFCPAVPVELETHVT